MKPGVVNELGRCFTMATLVLGVWLGGVASGGAERATIRSITTSGRPALGEVTAPVTMIGFSDFACPLCRRFFEETLPALRAEYIDAGRLRYVFRHFPITRLNPHARHLAAATYCVGEQGSFWAMHDWLFRGPRTVGIDDVRALGQRLGVDRAGLDACLDQRRHTAAVEADADDGVAAGVRGTPTFFVGRTRATDAIDAIPIVGAQPLAVFRRTIDALLDQRAAEEQ